MYFLKKILFVISAILFSGMMAFAADSATSVMQLTIPEYTKIEPVTSPVLTANITDRTGNLYSPLYAKFRVITNVPSKKLYLQANVVTESGYEESMFTQGGRVYIAFANIAKKPTSAALEHCKYSAVPKDSPGVVAYPILAVNGVENVYLNDKNKYELSIKNGIAFVNVHVGSHILKTSFAGNDPKGFYQAVLSITEADI